MIAATIICVLVIIYKISLKGCSSRSMAMVEKINAKMGKIKGKMIKLFTKYKN
jgi:hypothetical protein